MELWVKVEQGVRIFVNDINPSGKKPILFIHGWPANHKMFEYQYNQLIQMDYRPIGIDVRGFGNSDKPVHGYNYNRLADDILSVVQALGLNNFTLAGHSTGGPIAIRYMSRHSGYGVSSLALFASAAPSLVQRPGFPYGVKPEVIEEKFIQPAYNDRPKMLRDFGDIFFYKKVSEPFSDWFFGLGLQAASWSTIAISKAWIEEELFNDLPQIYVPTLIMHGIHDQVVPYQLGVIQNQGIKNSKLTTFEDSGHGLFYDERDKFNKELVQFINETIR